MSEYFLFLDELKANKEYPYFCLGGCFIEDVYYRKTIVPYINKLKNQMFGKTTVVLHEHEIAGKSGDYKVFKNGVKNKFFWDSMNTLIKDYDIRTLCVGVDVNKLKSTYPTKGKMLNSEYYVALQIILENFVHFLQSTDSTGCVHIESRGLTPDYQLQEQYDIIRQNGTLFLPKEVFQKRLKTISFPLKIDNSIGLQIADFIPNPIARHFTGVDQKENSLFESIRLKSYDGGSNLIERFGIKKVL